MDNPFSGLSTSGGQSQAPKFEPDHLYELECIGTELQTKRSGDRVFSAMFKVISSTFSGHPKGFELEFAQWLKNDSAKLNLNNLSMALFGFDNTPDNRAKVAKEGKAYDERFFKVAVEQNGFVGAKVKLQTSLETAKKNTDPKTGEKTKYTLHKFSPSE